MLKCTLMGLAATLTLAAGSAATAGNVTPSIIFGSGNANGGFTLSQETGNVEVGLRAKLRHNASGFPENTFNYNGVDTYYFPTGVAPTQSAPTGVWSFEWSINTDVNGNSEMDLADYTYELTLEGPNGTLTFDPIHDADPTKTLGVVFWDHNMGDYNSTAANDVKATIATPVTPATVAAGVAQYDAFIDDKSVAQNSWKAHWYFLNYDPNDAADYKISLKVFDVDDTTVLASSSIIVSTPTPAAAGMGLIGGLGLLARRRRTAPATKA